MKIIDSYLNYVGDIRRYSPRTVSIYADVLNKYATWVSDGRAQFTDADLVESLNVSQIRQYEVYLMDKCKMVPRTVGLHLSALSGFCRYLLSNGLLKSNPVRLIRKPKVEKRLPSFYRKEAMEDYFEVSAQPYKKYASHIVKVVVFLVMSALHSNEESLSANCFFTRWRRAMLYFSCAV